MADRLTNKVGNIEIHLGAEEAERAAVHLGNTLKRIASGIPLNDYFKDTAVLIADLEKAYKQFQTEAMRGDVSQGTAESLMKLSNAVTAVATRTKQDITSLVPSFDQMRSAVDQATKQAGVLSHAFSVSNFTEAFDSFSRLKAAGVDFSDILHRITSENDLSKLVEQNETLRNQLAWSQSDVQDLQRELDRLSNTDLEDLTRQLDRLRSQAADELNAFFVANNIPMDWEHGYERALDQITESARTSGEAITSWKERYGELLGQTAHGTGSMLDPELFDELASKMQPILDRINELEGVIRNIGSGATNANTGALKEVVDTLTASGKATEGAKELLGVIDRITAGSKDNVDTLRRTLSALGDLDKIKISKASMTNLSDFLTSVKNLPDISKLATLSSINLQGFNDLNVRKASLQNLATYLPVIASVDIDKINALATMPLDQLNNLKINIDLGKDKFANEANAVKELNNAFRTHAGVISAAIEAEGRKYDTSVRLTEQLKREKDALEGVASAGGSTATTNNDKSNGNLQALYKEQLRLRSEIFKAERDRLDANNKENTAISDRVRQLEKELAVVNNQIRAEENKIQNQQRLAQLQSKQTERIKEEETKNPIASGKQQDDARVRQMNEYFRQRDAAYAQQIKYETDLANAEGERKAALERSVQEQQQVVANLDVELQKYQDLAQYAERKAKSDADAVALSRKSSQSLDITSGKNLDAEAAAWDNLSEKLNQFGMTQARLGTYSAQLQQDYANLANTIQTRSGDVADAASKFDQLRDAVRAADKAAQEQNKNSDIARRAEITYDKLTNKLTTYFHRYESEIKRHPQLVAQYNQLLQDLGQRGFGVTKRGTEDATAALQQFMIECEKAGVGTNTFLNKLIGGFGNKLLYGGLARLAAEFRKLVRQIYTNVKEIDAAATELRIVTNGTAADMERYYSKAADSAQRLAVSIKDVLESTTTFARLGYSANESNLLAEYTAMLTKVGNIDTQEATDAVTALVKAFNIDLSSIETVMDQMVEIGNNFPISVSQLAEGMNNAGSALAAAGNTVEQSFALLTAANTTVQDISKASTALRTMSARIRRTSSEAMPEGEEAITESKYNELVESLSHYQVSLVDINNEYRTTYDIVKDIAAAWDQMTSMEQAAITEAIAGTRNQNVFMSLVTQFKEAEGAFNAAKNAGGAMESAYGAYLDSIEGHTNALKASYEDFSHDFLNSDIVKTIVDILNGLVKILDVLAEAKMLFSAIIAVITGINIVKRVLVLQQAALGLSGTLKGIFSTASGAASAIGLIVSLLATVLIPVLDNAITTTKELRSQYEQEENELKDLQDEYEKTSARITELNDLKATDTFSEANQLELDQLREKNVELERELKWKQLIADEDKAELVEKTSRQFNGKAYSYAEEDPLLGVNIVWTDQYGWLMHAQGELADIQKQIDDLNASGLDVTNPREYQSKLQDLEAQRSNLLFIATEIINGYDAVKAYLDGPTTTRYGSLIEAFRDLIFGEHGVDVSVITHPIEQIEESVDTLGTIAEKLATFNMQAKAMKAHGGNIDLNMLPSVKITDSNKSDLTKFGIDGESGTYGFGAAKVYQNKKVALLVSPVLPNGQVLSEKELDKYVKQVIATTNAAGDNNYTAYDDKGLLIGTFGDKTTYDANRQAAEDFIASFRDLYEQWQSTTDQDVAAALYQQMQKLAQYAPTLSSVSETFADVEEKFTQLGNAINEFEKNGNITLSTLGKINSTFGDLSSFDQYVRVLTNATSTTEDVTKATEQLALEYLSSTNALDMFRGGNQSVISAMLQQIGVSSNAQSALQNFANAMVIASSTGLDLSAQIAEIWSITSAALAGSSAIQSLFSSALMSSKGYEELYPTMNEDGTPNEFFLASGLSSEEWYKQQMMNSLQLNMQNSLKVNLDKLKTLGTGGGGGGGGNTTDKYIADIDQFRKEIEALNQVQEKRAEIERDLNRIENEYVEGSTIDLLWQQIVLQRRLVDTYGDEQNKLHALNNARDEYIKKGVELLEQWGFIVDYNDETNDLFIQNQEHLNEDSFKELIGNDLTQYELASDMTLQVIGKYKNAQEAANGLIKNAESVISAITEWNEANKDNSDSWWDIADSIAGARKQVLQLLQDIVDAASNAVDNMQNVYDTLHKAADEFADTGFVSIDTVQSLIGLGTEYMQYLIDENGQLVINEERIKDIIAAKMEQLAVENAMAYVEALRIAHEQNQVEEMERLLYATQATTEATWGLVYASLELLGLEDDQKAAALHNINTIRSLAQASIQSIGISADQSSTKVLESMKKGVDDILKYVMDMIKQQIEDQKTALEGQKQAYSDIISKQKESLKLTKQDADYKKSVNDKLKEMAKLQAKIDALSLDTSRDAQAKRAQLLEELAEQQEALAEEQNEHAIEAQEEALDKMEEEYHKEKDNEIEILENSISSYQKLYDKAIDYINTHWNTLYDELIAWNYEYGSVLNSEITEAWDNCLAAAERYGSYLTALTQVTNDLAAAKDNLVVGSIGDFDYSWSNEEMAKAEEHLGKSTPETPTQEEIKVEEPEPVKSESEHTKEELLDEGYGRALYISGFDRAAWATAHGLEPSELQAYINKMVAQGYPAPKYPRDHYFLQFHSGGVVGDGSLKQDEVLAKLQKGEVVLTRQQEKTMDNVVDFMSALKDRLNGALARTRTPSLFGSANYRELAAAVGGSGTTVSFGDVYITGADKDTVAKHKEVNREFVNEVIKVLNIRR